MVDIADCCRSIPDTVGLIPFGSAGPARMASHSLGAWSHLAGSAKLMVLVYCWVQSLFAGSGVHTCLADVMGQAIAKNTQATHRIGSRAFPIDCGRAQRGIKETSSLVSGVLIKRSKRVLARGTQ